MMARFRCGNEEREREQKRCRMCREESGRIEHVWNRSGEMRERGRERSGEKY
jgi:hypothetical protein